MQSEPRRELALVHHALADEVGIFAMLDHESVEHAAVGQGPAQNLRVGQRLRAVRVGDGAGFLEQAELRRLLPCGAALGERGHRMHPDDAAILRPALDEIDRGASSSGGDVFGWQTMW